MSDPRVLSTTTITATVDERDRLRLDAVVSSDAGNALEVVTGGLARTRGWPFFQAYGSMTHGGVTFQPVPLIPLASNSDPTGIVGTGKVVLLDTPGVWLLNAFTVASAVTSGGFAWDVQQPVVWAGGSQQVCNAASALRPAHASSIVRVPVGEVVTLTPLVYLSAAVGFNLWIEGVRVCPVLAGEGA